MVPPIPTKELLKMAWPALAFVVVAVVIVAAGIAFGVNRCDAPQADDGPDYIQELRDKILADVDAAEKDREERIDALEAEMFDLREQVRVLDEEIADSVRERKEIHDALSNARSIRDVDRILKRGIPGVSGRTN